MATLAELELRVKSIEAEVAARRLDRMTRSSRRADTAAERIDRRFQSLGRTVLGLVTAFVALRTAQRAFGAAVDAIRVAGEFEAAEISLEAFLGNAERANQIMRELEQTSRDLGASFDGVLNVSRLLAAQGFTDVGQLTRLTNAMARFTLATGRGEDVVKRLGVQIAQIQASGFLRAEELRAIRDIIPVARVAEELSLTTGEFLEAVENRAITSADALEALVRTMERIGEAADEVAGGTAAAFRRLEATSTLAARDIGQVLSVSLQVSDVLGDITSTIEDLGAAFQGLRAPLAGAGLLLRSITREVAQIAAAIRAVERLRAGDFLGAADALRRGVSRGRTQRQPTEQAPFRVTDTELPDPRLQRELINSLEALERAVSDVGLTPGQRIPREAARRIAFAGGTAVQSQDAARRLERAQEFERITDRVVEATDLFRNAGNDVARALIEGGDNLRANLGDIARDFTTQFATNIADALLFEPLQRSISTLVNTAVQQLFAAQTQTSAANLQFQAALLNQKQAATQAASGVLGAAGRAAGGFAPSGAQGVNTAQSTLGVR